MLQHLVRVDDVERPVVEGKVVHVGNAELDVGSALVAAAAAVSTMVAAASTPTTRPGLTRPREVDRDVSGSASHVEEIEARLQRGEEIARRVLRRAPAVRPQHALVVAVCVAVRRVVHGVHPAGVVGAGRA